MKAKQWLLIGASVLTLGLTGCTNPIGLTIDYLEHGSRKAKISDYKGMENVKDFKKQVKVYDNFVEVCIGEYETEMHSYLVQENKEVTKIVKMPVVVRKYYDFNNDGNVDEYEASNNKEGLEVINIQSKVVWDAIYAPKAWTFNDAQKYADKKLQNIIDEDYKLLREKGTRLEGKTYTPSGTWFDHEDYPIKMDEEPNVKIELKIEK